MSNATPSRARVLLPLPLVGPLDYAVPPGMRVVPGDLVQVPLNGRPRLGVVWQGAPDSGVAEARLRPISAVLPGPALREGLRRFIDFVAAYTLTPPGEVLAMALRAYGPPRPIPPADWLVAAPGAVGASLARRRILAAAAEPGSAAELAERAGTSRALVRAMRAGGELVAADPPVPDGPEPEAGPALSADQMAAAATLIQAVAGGFSVTLLQGVTGSGKTEVYFEAIRAAREAGRQALVLLPEIALSVQWRQRFLAGLHEPAHAWHSELGTPARRATWRAVAEGRANVVVGARSALFLPFADLGLIIVDEEHDASFKQEEGVIYHARDMAVARGQAENVAVILASATPSLETLVNVGTGRYGRVSLPARAGGAVLPTIRAVDLRAEPPARGQFLSPTLIAAVAETLGRGEQALLFLNRRGYAPLTLCRACGHRCQCPHCTAWLVEHRARRVLTCHHCGYQIVAPSVCPACGAEGSLSAVGPGVERIAEVAAAQFPAARIATMTSDTVSGTAAAAAAAAAITERRVDLIIGTQVIAKGWHFPFLTLVGVVDADLGLTGGDLRAGERMLQLLDQVGGRAGRGAEPGRVLLQTYTPAHPVIQALLAADAGRFLAAEEAVRRDGGWPPYGRLAALILSSSDALAVAETARALGRAAPAGEGIAVFGPAPAPLAVLRGRHRHRLLLRTRRDIGVQALIAAWRRKVVIPSRVRLEIDIDPMSFL